MNYHRLRTNFEDYLNNKNYIKNEILEDTNLVLLSQSNLELYSNGQILIKSSPNFLRGIQVSIEVYNEYLTLKKEF